MRHSLHARIPNCEPRQGYQLHPKACRGSLLTPEQLRARRLALGLTQAQLASLLGASTMTIYRWEKGTRGIRRPALIELKLDQLSATKLLTPSRGSKA